MPFYLDDNDRALMISQIEAAIPAPVAGGTLKRAPLYSALSTICIGRATAGGNYVLTNFKLNYDLLKHVFDAIAYNSLGILDTNSQVYQFNKIPAPTPRPSRSVTAKVTQLKRKTGSNAFQGRRVRFKIPTAKAALLYPNGFKKTSARESASMIFPYAATNPQIAAWFSTHQSPGGTNVGAIVTERGTKLLYGNLATQAVHDAEVGIFNLITRNRLKATTSVEADPA